MHPRDYTSGKPIFVMPDTDPIPTHISKASPIGPSPPP